MKYPRALGVLSDTVPAVTPTGLLFNSLLFSRTQNLIDEHYDHYLSTEVFL